jgi:hypothetical protein
LDNCTSHEIASLSRRPGSAKGIASAPTGGKLPQRKPLATRDWRIAVNHSNRPQLI